MDILESIMTLAEQELNAIAKNGKFRSREEIDSVEKLVKTMQKIYCIWDMQQGGSNSYAYRKRDSMGRYSRSYPQMGYSNDFAEDLRGLMHEAPDDQTRQTIQRMLDQMGR